MQMDIKETKIPGCYELLPIVRRDERGSFIKTFHKDVFIKHGLENDFAEEYYSISTNGVLRGLHFQLPPYQHVKLVYCVEGEVLDVVVDLRVGSPTYGQYEMFQLNSIKANMIYIPKGLAHGFYVASTTAIMMYKVSTVYSPSCDSGILWNSVGIPWPSSTPVISERDNALINFNDFISPFVYEGASYE